MTRITEETGKFLKELLLDSQVPSFIKTGITSRLTALTPAELDARAAVATVKDATLSNAVRLAALQRVIDYYKGVLP